MPDQPIEKIERARELIGIFEALRQEYGALTDRSLIDDTFAVGRIEDLAMYGEVTDESHVIREYLGSGHTPSIFGDDRWAEAGWDVFTEEVRQAVEDMGLLVEPEEDE